MTHDQIGGIVPAELDVDALRLAMAVVRYGHGSRRIASLLRLQEPRAAYGLYEQLTEGQRDDVDRDAQALEAAGADAVLLGQGGYPTLLASLRQDRVGQLEQARGHRQSPSSACSTTSVSAGWMYRTPVATWATVLRRHIAWMSG